MLTLIVFVWFSLWILCRVVRQDVIIVVCCILGWVVVVLYWLLSSGRLHS